MDAGPDLNHSYSLCRAHLSAVWHDAIRNKLSEGRPTEGEHLSIPRPWSTCRRRWFHLTASIILYFIQVLRFAHAEKFSREKNLSTVGATMLWPEHGLRVRTRFSIVNGTLNFSYKILHCTRVGSFRYRCLVRPQLVCARKCGFGTANYCFS